MIDELKVLKWHMIYILISVVLTVLTIWLNKEEFWSILIHFVDWNGKIVVTNILESLVTYIKMSIMWGLLLSLSTSGIWLLILFIKPGYYNYEWKKTIWSYSCCNNLQLNLFIINLLIYPFISRILFHWLTDSNKIELLGKISELHTNMWQVWSVVVIGWSCMWIMNITKIRQVYLKNRKTIWLLWYLLIGFVTPPDIVVVLIILVFTIMIWESICLIKEIW